MITGTLMAWKFHIQATSIRIGKFLDLVNFFNLDIILRKNSYKKVFSCFFLTPAMSGLVGLKDAVYFTCWNSIKTWSFSITFSGLWQ